MNKQQEEILTFEIYQREGEIIIHLPVANITPIGFKLDNNNLLINLEDKDFIINNLTDRIIRYIHKGNCFIVENLDHLNGKTFHVVL